MFVVALTYSDFFIGIIYWPLCTIVLPKTLITALKHEPYLYSIKLILSPHCVHFIAQTFILLSKLPYQLYEIDVHSVYSEINIHHDGLTANINSSNEGTLFSIIIYLVILLRALFCSLRSNQKNSGIPTYTFINL